MASSDWTIEKSECGSWVEDGCQPELGRRVQPDGWNSPSHLVESDWDKADYRLPSCNYLDLSFAVKVQLSARSKKVYCSGRQMRVRVQITFVGDCQADVVVHGWMWV